MPVSRARRPTSTSAFGVGRRESHDASGFYDRFSPPVLSQHETVNSSPIKDKIVTGDARHMDEVEDASVALVVTSPPYFAGKEYEEALGEGHIPASYLDYECSVATSGGRVVGFLVVRQVAPDEREILNLAVDAAERRRGVARKLLETELQRVKNQWFLEVRASNSSAIKLYESAGFRVAGRRESYYQNPAESGIVMMFVS